MWEERVRVVMEVITEEEMEPLDQAQQEVVPVTFAHRQAP